MSNSGNSRFLAVRLAAMSAALVVASAGGAASAAADATTSGVAASAWQSYPVPVGGQAVLDAVVSPAAEDTWVGGFTIGANGFSPLMLHWNGSAFAAVSVPDTTRIDELSSTGPEDLWAMTDVQPLRWSGTKWLAIPLAAVPDMDQGGTLAADGPDDAWYVGSAYDPADGSTTSLVEEWNGQAWTRLALPAFLADGGLAGIAAQGPDDVWVDGLTTGGAVLLAHWDGHSWTAVPAPATGFAYTNLSELVIRRPNDVWLAGWGETTDVRGADRDSLVMHWNGCAWALSATPPGNGELDGIAGSADGLWAVGDTYHAPGVPYAAYALRWAGTDWMRVPVPATPDASFDAVAAAPGGGVWVVGSTTQDADTNPAVTPLLLRH
jgi:hypothetical protein